MLLWRMSLDGRPAAVLGRMDWVSVRLAHRLGLDALAAMDGARVGPVRLCPTHRQVRVPVAASDGVELSAGRWEVGPSLACPDGVPCPAPVWLVPEGCPSGRLTDARLLREALAAVCRRWEADARTRVPRQGQPVRVVAGVFDGPA